MKKTALLITLIFITTLIANAGSSAPTLIELTKSIEFFNDFSEYELSSKFDEPKKDVEFYTKDDYLINYADEILEHNTSCEKIEFSYFMKRLLYYSVHCVDNKKNIVSELNQKLNGYADYRFKPIGYYAWRDNDMCIIYDIKNNIVTIGKNNSLFFSEGPHALSNYSPFIKEGKWTEMFKKYNLEYFPVLTYNSFSECEPYVTNIKTMGRFKEATLSSKIYVRFNKDENTTIDKNIYMYDKFAVKFKIKQKTSLKFLFFDNFLVSYTLNFKKNGKLIFKYFYNRYGIPTEGGEQFGYAAWETNHVKITISYTYNKETNITIARKPELNIAKGHMNELSCF